MKLTKGTILKLYNKKNQSIKKKTHVQNSKSIQKSKTYKKKRYLRLEKKSLKNL